MICLVGLRKRTITAAGATAALMIASVAFFDGPMARAQAGPTAPVDQALASERWEKEKRLKDIAIVERKHMIIMRDGTRLATDIYRPKDTTKTYPVLFVSTPYNVNHWDIKLGAPADMARGGRNSYENITKWVSRGYAYVLQNQRGHFYSEGMPDNEHYTSDVEDTLSWIERQPWSNGRVGAAGCSSLGSWQPGVGAKGHSALKALMPMSFGGGGRVGRYRDWDGTYHGGALYMLTMVAALEDQNRQRPVFSRDIPREDLERLATYYDMAPNWPPIDWPKAAAHLPLNEIFPLLNSPMGRFSHPIGGKTPFLERTPGSPEWDMDSNAWSDDQPFSTPAIWFVSWYDHAVASSLALYNSARANAVSPEIASQQYLVIGPNTHCRFPNEAREKLVLGERDLGDTRYDYDTLDNLWFDHFLQGAHTAEFSKLPKVQYYTMGLNKWQSSDIWPPRGAVSQYLYIGSVKGANTAAGDGMLLGAPPARERSDSFDYDPMNPVPSLGGAVAGLAAGQRKGSFDQRELERREDVLVYTTRPLTRGIEMTGFVEPVIYISSSAKDTDISVKLVDVYPDGRAFNVDETIQRVRYRGGYDKARLMEPGKVYKVEVEPMATSNWFAPGHRIRIEVSSSNFPRFDRNLNTGGKMYDEKQGVIARNRIHHGRRYPSHLKFTAMPG